MEKEICNQKNSEEKLNETQISIELKPAFSKNNIALLFVASENYMPYFSTMLQSIIKNSSKKNNYDIIVFHTNITEKSETIINHQTAKYKNMSVRFYNVTSIMQPYMHLYVFGHFRIETYYRLLAPYILNHYDKIVYLDTDLIVQEDVAKLYNIVLSNEYLLAACKDADSAGLYNGFEPNKKEYVDNILKLKNPYDYFQAGVIVFNLDTFRNTYTSKYIMEFSIQEKWQLLDQDILNCLAENRVLYMDMAWNVMYDWNNIRIEKIIALAPEDLRNAYMQSRKNPYIIHYAGPNKPWENKNVDFGKTWWKYAISTPYIKCLKKNLAVNNKNRFKNKLKKTIKIILLTY